MVADPASKKLSSVTFPEIVGQPDLKQVLLLAAAHDDLSGAVITGEKGTAKSTAVRALVDLLPEQRVVADCPYNCDPADPATQCSECQQRPSDELPVEHRRVPLVTLPLGATRDRVVGTLSVADALDGEAEFDPGLLARANRGILYVDEINLLDDHLVDVLLDAAASGVNTVERDGMSISHPAAFTLIGTMNPEEGDLRPQLRDRFDLQATVTGCEDTDDRVDIIDQALAAETDTKQHHAEAVEARRNSLQTARESIDSVTLPSSLKTAIAELCTDAGVDGHRADIATARAAIASAALDGRPKVIESDIQQAAQYTLPHRLRSEPFAEPPDLDSLLDDHFDAGEDSEGDSSDTEPDGDETTDSNDDETTDSNSGDASDTAEGEESDNDPSGGDESESGGDHDAGDADHSPDGSADNGGTQPNTGDTPASDDSSAQSHDSTEDGGDTNSEPNDDADSPEGGQETEATPVVPGETRADVGEAETPPIEHGDEEPTETAGESDGTHRGNQQTGGRGSRVRTEPATGDQPIDAAASVRTAAKNGHSQIEPDDLRQSVRQQHTTATIVFAVDASASMQPAMERAKGVVLEFLRDAYEQRDEVAFVAFGGDDAEVLLPPTSSVSLAARHLKELPTGDRTPLPAGINTASEVLSAANPAVGVVVLVTDGRGNVADGSPTAATRQAARNLAEWEVVIVDASSDRSGLVEEIVAETAGRVIPLSALTPAVVTDAVDEAVDTADTE